MDDKQIRGLGTLLRALVDQLDGDVQHLYGELGLNFRPRYTPIVRHLERQGPSTLRDIQHVIGLSHSAVSQTISQMAKDGLVATKRGGDGRERVVSLSDRAREMLPALRRCWERVDAGAASLSVELGVDLEEALTNALLSLAKTPLRERME